MTDLDKHPFYFEIGRISKEINYLIEKEKFEKAIEVLENVEYKWMQAKNESRVPTGLLFNHLQDYSIKSLALGLADLPENATSTKTTDHLASWIHQKIQEITELKINKEIVSNEIKDDLNVKEVSILSHKIALLHELGILDLINKEFKSSPKNNNTQKAKLLSIILGETDKKTVESIRKLLSYIENPGHKQSPINSESTISVEKILLEFGLTKKKL
jgi:hypothetical protein